MNTNLLFFKEPLLEFAYGQVAEDCRDGLTLFGPYQKANGPIRAGIIGTPFGIKNYSSFVRQINKPIYSSSMGRPFFPGFKTVFGIEWPEVPVHSIELDPEEIKKLLETKNLKERTYSLVSLYLEKIINYTKDEEKAIDIWYIIVPKEIWISCRPKSKTGKAKYTKEQIEKFLSGQTSLFDEELELYSSIYESDSDFHDQFKARALKEKIQSPVQIILESTLLFLNKTTGEPYIEDMKAHLAWTQSTSTYYKLGYLPWKLANVREGVCYIGLVFKKLDNYLSKKGYACSAAQMFLDSGDGIVFRGNIGPWLSKNERTFHLDKENATNLITMALDSYKQYRGAYPKELFIHGRTMFSDEEWLGFSDAIKCTPNTQLVGVTINIYDSFRIFENTRNKKCNYGNLRGLAYIIDDKCGYLWTKGYIPKIETANHMEIAVPIKITISRGTSDIKTVFRDILCLTKLNYNACIYGDGLPVTLRFSDNIGDILTAIKDVNWPAKQFKYYI